MSDEAGIWLSYAEENREVAALSLGSHRLSFREVATN